MLTFEFFFAPVAFIFFTALLEIVKNVVPKLETVGDAIETFFLLNDAVTLHREVGDEATRTWVPALKANDVAETPEIVTECLPAARFSFNSSEFVVSTDGKDILRTELTPTCESAVSIAGSLNESLNEYVPDPAASARAPLPPVTVTVAFSRLTGIQVGLA